MPKKNFNDSVPPKRNGSSAAYDPRAKKSWNNRGPKSGGRDKPSFTSPPKPEPTIVEDTTFAELGLQPGTLKAITDLGFEVPTPIQALAIPVLLTGCDLIGLAQTGT